MGTIMHGGNLYGGGGGGGATYTAGTGIEITAQNVINAKEVSLTQAQYNALQTIDPDTLYFITDAGGGGGGGGGGVDDVKINNVSIVVNNVANIPTTSTATSGSTDLITSGGVYAAIDSAITQVLAASY